MNLKQLQFTIENLKKSVDYWRTIATFAGQDKSVHPALERYQIFPTAEKTAIWDMSHKNPVSMKGLPLMEQANYKLGFCQQQLAEAEADLQKFIDSRDNIAVISWENQQAACGNLHQASLF
jgi:hypothetical protein